MLKTTRFLAAVLIGLTLSALAGLARADALSNYMENKAIDWLLRAQTYTPPTTGYWALGTNTCSDSGTPTEPSGNGYARVSYTASLANWAGTQGAGTTVASSGTGGSTSNNAIITWSASTSAWGTLQSVWYMDASTGGNALLCNPLASSLNVSGAGFTLSFAAGQLTFQIDN